MPRARLDASGPKIAKAGYDIDTASPANMNFDTGMVALRLRYTGIVTCAAYTGDTYASLYDRAIVTFPTPFSKPPLVLFAGRLSDTESNQTPFVVTGPQPGGWTKSNLPGAYMVISSETGCTIFRRKVISGYTPQTVKYFVFANTLED